MLSIVAGEYKGTRLQLPDRDTTRPVSQKVRAAIFNILMSHLADASVLDLYAGSGALGLEALSQGASSATFVDNNTAALRTIRDNIAQCGAQQYSKVVRQDVGRYIASSSLKYDCIFFDPPYRNFNETLLKQVTHLLQLDGVVVVSLSAKTELTNASGVEIISEKVYGDTKIVLIS